MILSSCGLICDECEHFGISCKGCHQVEGKPFWAAEMMPTGVCTLYQCAVNDRKFKDCGGCAELPCSTFLQMKDPSSTDEEHQKAIIERVERLKN